MATGHKPGPAPLSPPTTVDGRLLKHALLGSLSWLSANQEEVNRLNVFPVPDGDTGTNMLLTLQSSIEDIKASDEASVAKVARVVAHGSLMGARGNSGVILSQIFRGFAKAVEGRQQLNPTELAGAFEEAANAAYRAVPKPTEGTILTVAREAGKAAAGAAERPDATVASVIKAAAEGAAEAVKNTPNQLKVLREAGVVDAGGFGLLIMLEGMLRTVEETGGIEIRQPVLPAAQVAMQLPEGGWGYCTEFLLQGRDLDLDAIRIEIEALGNSVLVVGEPELAKVHVHTDDPTRVIAVAAAHGKLQKLNVGDMSTQHRRILEEAGDAETPREPSRANGVGLVAVVAGNGLADIFRGLGVDGIVEGGQTMNPSTQDILSAMDGVPYGKVVLLPNNKNVVMAAREAVKLSGKEVGLVETHTVPQGIAATVAFSPQRPYADNVAAMSAAAGEIQTIELTHAVRDTRTNGMRVHKGDVIALVNDRLDTCGKDYDAVATNALQHLDAGRFELVTVYRGQGVTKSQADGLARAIRRSFPDLEVELQAGGQEHYPFIISVE
jgi:DAK2 domain fusion protein YloV